MASWSDSERRTSPITRSTSANHSLPCNREASRARHRTRAPALSSLGTSRPPMYPVTPVTRTDCSFGVWSSTFKTFNVRRSRLCFFERPAILTLPANSERQTRIVGWSRVLFFETSMEPNRAKELEAEIELLRRVGQGDRGSFEQLYDRLSGVLYSAAYRLLHNEASAEDVL